MNPLSAPNFRCLCVLVIAANLAPGTSLIAQSPASGAGQVRRDPDAVALIRTSLLKMGGLAAAHRDTVATGTMLNENTGKSSTLVLKTSGTDSVRNEVGSDFVFVRSNFGGHSHYDGKDHKVAWHSLLYHRAEHLPGLLLLSEVESPNLRVQMIGLENVDGVPASHIRLSVVPQDVSDARLHDLMSETHVWIDSQGLVVKARTFMFSPEVIENRSPVDLYYSDYRQVDRFLVPFHIVRAFLGQKEDITFTSVDLNAALSPADFQ